MYRRFWTICLIIGAALLALSAVGLSSLKMHERSLRVERENQFMAVAEQIRYDLKTKLDEFLQTEQRRPYTDYQYAYVPETTNETDAMVRSPLADSLVHGLAFGHFQIDAAGNITTPYVRPGAAEKDLDPALLTYLNTLRTQVLESLNRYGRTSVGYTKGEKEIERLDVQRTDPTDALPPAALRSEPVAQRQAAQQTFERDMLTRAGGTRARTYPIESLQEAQTAQTVDQPRGMVARNIENVQRPVPEAELPMPASARMAARMSMDAAAEDRFEQKTGRLAAPDPDPESTVQIRIEPFVPLVIAYGTNDTSIFPGQIFLVRHVQIENVHLLQGFRLNEMELAEQVQESARRLLREGMAAELNQRQRNDAAHTAFLDFGFGEIALNLLERDPGWIAARITQLNLWMTAILTVVWLAVVLAMVGLWRNLGEQVKLSRQKDDFISAVSHELRTPLTSIRMYTEMLEKDWVKDEAKRREYYGTMRQETERLTRLIENVLDFSRLQRGKRQFEFTMGDVNDCIRDVVEMMRPCAERMGFIIETNFSPIKPFAFDRDAVMQILINLIDNALKYAKQAEDKRILVRTRPEDGTAIIEVEDHGSGIPKTQQEKIFEPFYRCGDEATRQAVGTGLGLALVKRFAEAHRGGVEILNVKPAGALFRVRIAR